MIQVLFSENYKKINLRFSTIHISSLKLDLWTLHPKLRFLSFSHCGRAKIWYKKIFFKNYFKYNFCYRPNKFRRFLNFFDKIHNFLYWFEKIFSIFAKTHFYKVKKMKKKMWKLISFKFENFVFRKFIIKMMI